MFAIFHRLNTGKVEYSTLLPYQHVLSPLVTRFKFTWSCSSYWFSFVMFHFHPIIILSIFVELVRHTSAGSPQAIAITTANMSSTSSSHNKNLSGLFKRSLPFAPNSGILSPRHVTGPTLRQSRQRGDSACIPMIGSSNVI